MKTTGIMLVLPLKFPKPRPPRGEWLKVIWWKLTARRRRKKFDKWAKYDSPTYLRNKVVHIDRKRAEITTTLLQRQAS